MIRVHRRADYRVWVVNGREVLKVRKASRLRRWWWGKVGSPAPLPWCVPLRAQVDVEIGLAEHWRNA